MHCRDTVYMNTASWENQQCGFRTGLTQTDLYRHRKELRTRRSLKFRIYVEEELYYPRSENKGADQLRGYINNLTRLYTYKPCSTEEKDNNYISFVVSYLTMFTRMEMSRCI